MRLQQYIINESNTIPTQEMIDFYEKRTKEHINKVRNNIKKYISTVKEGYGKSDLIKRSKEHDKSKYSNEEYLGYVWLTWFHKKKNEGDPITLSPEVKKLTEKVWGHHKDNNRHHPEYHNNPKNMSNEDLIEMVCDWAAMSQELGTNLELWIHKNATKAKYTDNQIKLIQNVGKIVL